MRITGNKYLKNKNFRGTGPYMVAAKYSDELFVVLAHCLSSWTFVMLVISFQESTHF